MFLCEEEQYLVVVDGQYAWLCPCICLRRSTVCYIEVFVTPSSSLCRQKGPLSYKQYSI